MFAPTGCSKYACFSEAGDVFLGSLEDVAKWNCAVYNVVRQRKVLILWFRKGLQKRRKKRPSRRDVLGLL